MAVPASSPPRPAFPYEFDPATRERARAYERSGRPLFLMAGTALPVGLALVLFLSGASARLADWTRSLFPSGAAADAAYVAAFAAIFAAATLPFSFYLGHARERRFGMTTRSAGAFLREALKGSALAVAMGLILLLPFFWLARNFADWWLFAAALYAGYAIVSAAVIPQIILPLFHKVEPLPDGPLRDAVLAAARAAGLSGVTNVVVLRESAKSPRANAFVHGIGRTRRIVLYDTLVKDFHPREVAFTVAHEIGHLARRDVPKSLALSLAVVVPELYLLSLFVSAAAPLGGAAGAGDAAVVPLLMAFVVSFGFASRPASAWLHRRSEARADAFALRATGDGQAGASMLRRICDLNLLDEAPPPLIERLLHTHPAPRHRIEQAMAFDRGRAVAAPSAPPP